MSSTAAAAIAQEADAGLASLLERTDANPDLPLGDAYHGRRVADLLAHLYAWHIVFEGWVAQERAGAVPATPAEGFRWADLDALNDALYEAHKERTYESARGALQDSHRAMLDLLATFTEEQLTDPDRYPWLKGLPLGRTAHECLAGHYAWAQDVLDQAERF